MYLDFDNIWEFANSGFSLSVSPSLILSQSVSLPLLPCLSVTLSLALSLHLSIADSPSLSLSLDPPLSLSLTLSLLPVSLSHSFSCSLFASLNRSSPALSFPLCLSLFLYFTLGLSSLCHTFLVFSLYVSFPLTFCLCHFLSLSLTLSLTVFLSLYFTLCPCLSFCLSLSLSKVLWSMAALLLFWESWWSVLPSTSSMCTHQNFTPLLSGTQTHNLVRSLLQWNVRLDAL